MMYAIEFERQNYNVNPPLKENVVVFLRTKLKYNNENIVRFEQLCWNELWKQYPVWNCFYNASNPPPTATEHLRYGFCTPSMGKVREL